MLALDLLLVASFLSSLYWFAKASEVESNWLVAATLLHSFIIFYLIIFRMGLICQ